MKHNTVLNDRNHSEIPIPESEHNWLVPWEAKGNCFWKKKKFSKSYPFLQKEKFNSCGKKFLNTCKPGSPHRSIKISHMRTKKMGF